MFSISMKYRFLEHGMFFKKGGGVSDIQTLASTKGLPGSQTLLNILNFPEDSSFKTNFDAVSFAFIITDWGLAFVQLQRRLEYESNKYVMNKKSGGLFNQTRFTLFDTQDIINLYSHGFCVYNGLIVGSDKNFNLEKYDRAIDEFVEMPDFVFSLPTQDYLRLLKKPFIVSAIKAIARAMQYNDQVIVILNENEFTLFERLVIVQEVEKLIIPLLGTPVSFALDYIVHPFSKIGIRFQGDNEINSSKARKIDLSEQDLDDYIDRVFEFLYLNTSSWQEKDKIKWQSRHKLLYNEDIALEFARQKRPHDAAKWLRDILLFGDDILNYYKTLFNYSRQIEKRLYKGYFNRQYENLKNNRALFESFLIDKEFAEDLLFSISESGFLETDFSLIDWAQIVVFSNTEMSSKIVLLKSHKSILTVDAAKRLLKWVRNKKDKMFFENNNIIYEFFKEKLIKDSLSAEFILENLSVLAQENLKIEVEYWCQYLSISDGNHSIWSWTNSKFRELKDYIFIALIEKKIQSGPNIEKWLDVEDKNKIKSLKDKEVFNRSVLVQYLNKIIEQEDIVTVSKRQQTRVGVTQQSDKTKVKYIESVEYDKISFNDEVSPVSRYDVSVLFDKTRESNNKKRIILRILLIIAFILIVSIVWQFEYVQTFNLSILNLPTPTNKIVTPLNPTEIINNAELRNVSQDFPTVLWKDLGFLYFTQLVDSNTDGDINQLDSQNLYFVDGAGSSPPLLQNEHVKDVFINNDNLIFYTIYSLNKTKTSIYFISDNKPLLLVGDSLLFDTPSVYPGDSKSGYDAAFVCQITDICLLSRKFGEGAVITRYEIDEQRGVHKIEPWSDPSTYFPSPSISALNWLDLDSIIFSYYAPGDTNAIYWFDVETQKVNFWIRFDDVDSIVDIKKWPGTNREVITLAILVKKQDVFSVFVVNVMNDTLLDDTIKKYPLPAQINNAYELTWDPQKNQIAFIGTLDNNISCKAGCLFLLDLLNKTIKLVNLGDGVRSIYWVTTK